MRQGQGEFSMLNIYAMLVLATILWAGHFVVARVLHTELPPFTFAFARWTTVFLLLTPFVLKSARRHRRMIRNHRKTLYVISLLSTVLYTSLIYYGLHFTTTINASLITATAPILIIIISRFTLNEPVSSLKAAGICCSLAGVWFILTQGHLEKMMRLHFNYGDVLLFASMVVWAFFSVSLKKLPKTMPTPLYLWVTAGMGAATLLPAAIWEIELGHPVVISAATCLGVLYAAFCASIMAYGFWQYAIKHLSPGKVSYFGNLVTLFTAVMGITFLGEHIHHYHLYGSLLVFTGIYFATVADKRIAHRRVVS